MARKKDNLEGDSATPREPSGLKRPRMTLELQATEEKPVEEKPATETGAESSAGASSGAAETEQGKAPESSASAIESGKDAPQVENTETAVEAGKTATGEVPGGGGAAGGKAEQAMEQEQEKQGAPRAPGLVRQAARVLAAAAALVVIALGLSYLAGRLEWPGKTGQELQTLEARLSRLESTLPSAGAGAEAAAKVAGAERRLAALEAAVKGLSGLEKEQARLAGETRALAAKVAEGKGAGDLEARLAAVEAQVRALSSLPPPQAGSGEAGGAANEAVRAAEAAAAAKIAALEARLAAAERAGGDLAGRLDRELRAGAKEADVAALKAELAAAGEKLAALSRSAASRQEDAGRSLTLLALTSLERAVERGDDFTKEIAEVKRVSGGRINLTALERLGGRRIPSLLRLRQEFPAVMEAMLTAAKEPEDRTVIGQLVAGAQSIVRVRKIEPDAEDRTPEAVMSRMEKAVNEGRLAAAVAEVGKLPPAAQEKARPWLEAVEGRLAVENAITTIENELRASLMGTGAPAGSPTP